MQHSEDCMLTFRICKEYIIVYLYRQDVAIALKFSQEGIRTYELLPRRYDMSELIRMDEEEDATKWRRGKSVN